MSNFIEDSPSLKKEKVTKLTKELRDVIVGKLLGDAHLETQNNGKTWRLKIEHSMKQKNYVIHLYNLFFQFVATPPKVVKNRSKDNIFFQTLSYGCFRFYGQQFYVNRKKVVPKIIKRLLTPRVLSYWYADDGSIKSKQSKAILLNTQGYTLKEVIFLCKVLRDKFLLDSWPRRQKEGWQIYISGKSYQTFKELIFPFLIPDMFYKLPEENKKITQLPKK